MNVKAVQLILQKPKRELLTFIGVEILETIQNGYVDHVNQKYIVESLKF